MTDDVDRVGADRRACVQPVTRRTQLPLCANQERQLLVEEAWRLTSRALTPLNGEAISHLVGPLDRAALQDALTSLVRRHAALRSSIWPATTSATRVVAAAAYLRHGTSRSGLYQQSIVERVGVPLRVRALDSQPASVESDLQAIVAHEIAEAFDYGAPPLIRAALVALEPDRHALILVAPHIVVDGWSFHVLVRDLLSLYAERIGGGPGVPRLKMQFHDFAVWQRDQTRTPMFGDAVDYWKAQWCAFGDALLHQSDFPAPLAAASTAGRGTGIETAVLSRENVERLSAFRRRMRVTLHHLMLTVAAVRLAHVTGRSRIALWEYYLNRTLPGSEDVVGWFGHAHLAGIDISTATTVGALLQAVRNDAFERFAHHQLSTAKLFEVWTPPRHGALGVGVDVNPASPIRELGPLRVEPMRLGIPPPMSLRLTAETGRDTLRLGVVYDRAVFDDGFVRDLFGDFQRTLLRFADDPTLSVRAHDG